MSVRCYDDSNGWMLHSRVVVDGEEFDASKFKYKVSAPSNQIKLHGFGVKQYMPLEAVWEAMRRFGEVVDVSFPKSSRLSVYFGWCVVTFRDVYAAKRIVVQHDGVGVVVAGVRVSVDFFHPPYDPAAPFPF